MANEERHPHEAYPNYARFFIGNFSRRHVWKSRSEEDECKNKSLFLSLNSCFAISQVHLRKSSDFSFLTTYPHTVDP